MASNYLLCDSALMIGYVPVGKFAIERFLEICQRDSVYHKHPAYESVLHPSCFVDSLVIQRFTGLLPVGHTQPTLLAFDAVPMHIDRPSDFELPDGHHRFIHLCLHGEFVLHIGDIDLEIKPGDCFVMNPLVIHSVSAMGECVTLVSEI